MRYAPDAPSHFILDMQRLTRALERYVVDLPGGWQGMDPGAPESITRPYVGLFRMGMANGWLTFDGEPVMEGANLEA